MNGVTVSNDLHNAYFLTLYIVCIVKETACHFYL